MTEKCVVTGGAGFIGSHVVDLLVQQGADVYIVDDLSTGRKENLNPKAKFCQGSICDLRFLQEVFKDATYVFHLAALPRIQPSFEDPVGHEEVNVLGTIRCLEALKAVKTLRKLVYSSSSACYGTPLDLPTSEKAAISPLSPYALQKYTAEQYCLILGERYQIPCVALRYFNAYGPRSFNAQNPFNAYSSVVGIFHNQRRRQTALTVTGDGSQKRDFIHVADIARANAAVARSSHTFKVYNVGAGKPISVLNLAKIFGGEIDFIPERKGEARITWADISLIKSDIGWQPTLSLEQGIGTLDKNN